MIINAKINYYYNIFTRDKYNTTKTWNNINEILNRISETK